MRDIGEWCAYGRRITRLALIALATVATVAAIAPPAMAAGSVTVTTNFENSPISLNTSDAVGYQLANTSGASQTVTFTDSLPPGVTLDNPIATTNTNGTGACTLVSSNAAPGASAVTLTVTVPSTTSTGSTVCTISFAIVASTPTAAAPDAYSGYSTASGLTVTTKPSSLTVLSNPTLSLTAPANGQSFSLGQISTASFACAASDPLDSIDSFYGTDDEGNQIESGAPIDTVDPGTHTLTVECYSAAGGGFVSQSVSYSVGSYALSAVRAAKTTDLVSFRTTVPASKLIAKVFYGKKLIGTTTVSPTTAGPVAVVIKPTIAGRKLLARLKGRWANLKLQTSLNPLPIGTGDQEITPAGATVLSRTVRLPLAHPAKKVKTAKKVRTARNGKSARKAKPGRKHGAAASRRHTRG